MTGNRLGHPRPALNIPDVDDSLLFSIGIMAPMILLALTVHECAHAWTARFWGDPTAESLGRISLNPLVHLDLMGSLTFLLSNGSFGWAKPVPYNPLNLRNRRWGQLTVSSAGPLANLLLAALVRLVMAVGPWPVLQDMMFYGAS